MPKHKIKAIEDEADVEGHHKHKVKAVEDEADVEGHSILPNPNLSIQLAQARQRDMERDLKQHKLENDSRKHNK
jgi:hypothetical protein